MPVSVSAPRAKAWVEEHFPNARGSAKAALILTYGAGVDAGLCEAQEVIEEMAQEFRRIVIAQDRPPAVVAAGRPAAS